MSIDIDGDGAGVLAEPRLFQLIRQRGTIDPRRSEIEFEGPGPQAFVFMFG